MKIFVSQPGVGGQIHQRNLLTILKVMSLEHEVDLKFIENASLLPHARSNHFSMFYHQDHDYLLSVDADMESHNPPGFLDEVIARAPKDAIIGGIYAKKAIDTQTGFSPVVGKSASGEQFVLDGRFVECESLGTGFLLVPRSVAEKMVAHYGKELIYEDEYIKAKFGHDCYAMYHCILDSEKKQWYGEDYSFCKRARDIGIKIYADCSLVFGHIGPTSYNLRHLIRR